MPQHWDMFTVKARFAPDPYPRDRKSFAGWVVRDPGSGRFVQSNGPVARVTASGELSEPIARRAARDKRVDELMEVIEALHGKTLAELAK
jgi:hypothetical protein